MKSDASGLESPNNLMKPVLNTWSKTGIITIKNIGERLTITKDSLKLDPKFYSHFGRRNSVRSLGREESAIMFIVSTSKKSSTKSTNLIHKS